MNGKLSFAQRLAREPHSPQPGAETRQCKQGTVLSVKPAQRTRYTQFREQYNDLRNMLRLFQTEEQLDLNHSPLLRPATPAKGPSEGKAISVQLTPNCQQAKENRWEGKWPSTNRQDYCPSPSLTLPKSEPNIPKKREITPIRREITAETSPITKKGIPNHGNTCYINSLLQCLFHLPHFNDYFADQAYADQANGKTKEVVEMYTSLYHNVVRKPSPTDVSTLRLKQSVSKLSSLFVEWQQEDAHEFMKKLLNSIHDELNRVQERPKYRLMYREVEGQSLEKKAATYWSYEKQRDDSYLYDAFCGQIYNSVRCALCGHESDSFENFLDLSVPLTPLGHSLEDLLQDYFGPEKLSDYFLCGKCNKSSKKSTKTMQLWRVPKFLILHLKRSQLQHKNVDPITIPQSLSLKPFMGRSNDRTARFCQYSLCAIVMHQGVLEGGHYWANVRQNGRWFEMDDEAVREVQAGEFRRGLQESGSSTAYILFYSSLYA